MTNNICTLKFNISDVNILDMVVDFNRKFAKATYVSHEKSASPIIPQKDRNYGGLERRLQIYMQNKEPLPDLIKEIELNNIRVDFHTNLNIDVVYHNNQPDVSLIAYSFQDMKYRPAKQTKPRVETFDEMMRGRRNPFGETGTEFDLDYYGYEISNSLSELYSEIILDVPRLSEEEREFKQWMPEKVNVRHEIIEEMRRLTGAAPEVTADKGGMFTIKIRVADAISYTSHQKEQVEHLFKKLQNIPGTDFKGIQTQIEKMKDELQAQGQSPLKIFHIDDDEDKMEKLINLPEIFKYIIQKNKDVTLYVHTDVYGVYRHKPIKEEMDE